MALGLLGESQFQTLEALNIITSLLSLLGILCVLSLMISVGVFGYKKKSVQIFHTISFNKLSFYIISFIFLSDLFRIIGQLLPTPADAINASFYSEISCRPGAFFKLFGSISTFCWMNITSYIVYKLLLYPHKFDKFYVERIKRIFQCISWPVALIISIIPLATGQYTMARSDGPWCFIDTRSSEGMTIAFFCYYLWLFIAWVLVNLVYVAIGKLLVNDYKKAKRLNDDEINRNNHNNIITKVPTIQRLQYFPLIFIFCWFWEILSISYNKLHPSPLFILKVFQISFTNLYGVFNTILFFYVIYNYNSNHVIYRNPKTIGNKKKNKKVKSSRKDKKVRKKLKKKLKKQGLKTANSSNSALKDRDDTDNGDGVQVTNTTTTTHYQVIQNRGNSHTNNDDLSGATVSLGIGNISVMSPTSISPKQGKSIADPIVLSDIDDEYDEEFEEDEYDLTDLTELDHYGFKKNVTIGYNEDESDDFYSDDNDDTNHDIGVIEDETTNITPKALDIENANKSFLNNHHCTKSSRTNTSNRSNNESGFGLLSDDEEIQHDIVDDEDGYR